MDRARTRVEAMYAAALRAVEPEAAVRRAVSLDDGALRVGEATMDLRAVDRVAVLGGGKAAAGMAQGVLGALGARISSGVVVAPHGRGGRRAGPIAVLEGGHPIPDDAAVRATRAVLALADALGPRDLALVVLSGGGSSLLCAPRAEVGLEGLASVTRRLLRSGARIEEINAVRTALSEIKGGGLARRVAPASVVTLALSDVPGDDPRVLASGPTVEFSSARAGAREFGSVFAEARRVVSRWGIDVPPAWLADRPLAPIRPGIWCVVANLATALDAAESAARSLGAPVDRIGAELVGEARIVGRALAGWLVGRQGPPRFLIAGGEPVVRVTGSGRGGRAQEVALAAAEVLDGSGAVLLAAGTDGVDGPTDAAGAVVDGTTWRRALARGLDPRRALEDNDSNTVLGATGDLLVTGPTGTNVRDLFIGWG